MEKDMPMREKKAEQMIQAAVLVVKK